MNASHSAGWGEFRDSGLLWFVNTTLHAFGRVIVLTEDDNGVVTDVEFRHTDWRGFSEQTQASGYERLAKTFGLPWPKE